MRIVMNYRGTEYVSKSEPMSIAECKSVAEGFCESLNKLDKAQFETEDGVVIFPENVLKESVVLIKFEDCDRNHPDNPKPSE